MTRCLRMGPSSLPPATQLRRLGSAGRRSVSRRGYSADVLVLNGDRDGDLTAFRHVPAGHAAGVCQSHHGRRSPEAFDGRLLNLRSPVGDCECYISVWDR